MKERNWASYPFNPARWPFYYGWMILVWGTLGIVMSVPGQTIGVSVFTSHLLSVLGMSRDQLSLAYMLGTISSSLLLPWVGRKYDQFGVRPIAFIATVGLGLVLLTLSQIDKIIFDWLHLSGTTLIIGIMFIAFLGLRFFGQGVLTLVSRSMMVQWFEQRRGFATGFSSVVISLVFSAAPAFMYFLISRYNWNGAWLFMAAIVGLIFPLLVLIFFRNNPEASGLVPDGKFHLKKSRIKLTENIRQFSLAEVKKQFPFWVFALLLAMQGLYNTGFTFHVISVFEEARLDEASAIAIFQPIAIIAVCITLVFSNISDYVPLKYLFAFKGVGACIGTIGLVLLATWEGAYYLIIAGHGIMGGLFSVLSSVTWPRYFGRKHLGAISGLATMLMVFGSALGPILFSRSLSTFGGYGMAGWICFAVFFLLALASFKADNPQSKLSEL